MPSLPPDFRSRFDDLLGVKLLETGPDRVVASLEVQPNLHQPGGIVHGGVYASLVETMSSVGAYLWLQGQVQSPDQSPSFPVGVSNHTDFLRSVSTGVLRAEGTPLQRGSSMQLWQVDITDEQGRRIAHGRVRLMNLRSR